MFFLIFFIIIFSQNFFTINSQFQRQSGLDFLAVDYYNYNLYNPSLQLNQSDENLKAKLNFLPPTIEVVEIQISLKKQCQDCLQNGLVFSPNGCEQKCQQSNRISVIQDQLDKTVVVKREKAQCVEEVSQCRELEELGSCDECLAYSGVWNINQGCVSSCQSNSNQDFCYTRECPNYDSISPQVCIQSGGVLCQNSFKQQCVKNCEECLCESCIRFDGVC